MLNRSSRRWLFWLTALLLVNALACSGGSNGDCNAPREDDDEVTELLQSARGNALKSHNGTASPSDVQIHLPPARDDLRVANESLQAVLMELSRRTLGRDDSDSGVILLAVVFLLGLVFLILTCWFAQACSPSSLSKPAPDIAFVQPSAALREDALPAICSKFLANTRDQPFTVRLAPLREDTLDWTLDVLSHWSHTAVMQVSLCRGATKLEGALAMRRSFVQVRSVSGKYERSLLGSINSMLEIFLPGGQKFGQLLPVDGAHVLHEESGREPRYSLGLENPSTISSVWLTRNGSPESQDADQLQEGLMKMGGQPLRHSRKGVVLGTVARPEGSNGDRLELMNVPGTDAVLLLLCTFGLVTFTGALELISAEQFQQEKTGLGWVSAPPPEESPTARSSVTAAGAALYERARDSFTSSRTMYS